MKVWSLGYNKNPLARSSVKAANNHTAYSTDYFVLVSQAKCRNLDLRGFFKFDFFVRPLMVENANH